MELFRAVIICCQDDRASGRKRTVYAAGRLILHYIGKVFKGYKVKGKSLIRVVRNADIDADALYDEDLDYREFMADLMKQRKKLSPVRLDMSREMDQAVIEHYAGIWRSHRTGYSRVKHR